MPPSGLHEVAFAIRGPISREDLPGLCERVCAVLGSSGSVVMCDVHGVHPGAVTVDALARLQLAAQRRGCCVRLRNACDELLELVELMGLSNVLVEGDASLAPTTRSGGAARSAGTASRRRGRR